MVMVQSSKIGGYPVMLKTAAGGGGRGMRVVLSEAEMSEVLSPSWVFCQSMGYDGIGKLRYGIFTLGTRGLS